MWEAVTTTKRLLLSDTHRSLHPVARAQYYYHFTRKYIHIQAHKKKENYPYLRFRVLIIIIIYRGKQTTQLHSHSAIGYLRGDNNHTPPSELLYIIIIICENPCLPCEWALIKGWDHRLWVV